MPARKSFAPGDTITDGLIVGRVIELGEMKMGCGTLVAYKVEILTGHEAGKTSIIPAIYARRHRPVSPVRTN
jgi:hypothetical protein